MTVPPDKLATWANAITVGRLLLSPLMFWAIPNDDQGSWIAVGAVVRALLQRRHRRLPRPPARHHVGRGVPRSARRQGAGARCDVHAREHGRVLGGAGDHHRRHASSIISVYRVLVGRQGHQRAGHPSWRSTRRSRQQFAVAFALFPPTALDATWLWNGLLWLAVVLALVSGGQYLWRARQLDGCRARVADRRPGGLNGAALRRPRRRHRAAARPDHRLELGVDRRRTRRERHRLARAGQGRRQRRADRDAAAPAARVTPTP